MTEEQTESGEGRRGRPAMFPSAEDVKTGSRETSDDITAACACSDLIIIASELFDVQFVDHHLIILFSCFLNQNILKLLKDD